MSQNKSRHQLKCLLANLPDGRQVLYDQKQ